MNSFYYLRNNVSLAIGVVCSGLHTKRAISMAELSLALPFIFDDKIVETLLDSHKYVTVRSLITMNKIALGNFNDRYLSLLPLVYQSLSLMLDADSITISDGVITARNLRPFDDMITESGSELLRKMYDASTMLFKVIGEINLSDVFKTLKVEL